MTTPINGNDPAFPRATTMNPVTGQPWNDEQPGIPIRALLAGMALQGIISGLFSNPDVCGFTVQGNVTAAIEYADALIAELNKAP